MPLALARHANNPPVHAMTTRAIGRYTILRELRRERFSVSYAAVDPVMNRQLVVKAVELLPAGTKVTADERKRVEQAFVRQAQAAGRLQHPHIITVFDAGLSHSYGFLVIERINGRPLHELIASGFRPAFVHCASIGARIADAIECAHNNGVAHGHLGPQHVVLQPDGAPKVSGFGGWIDDGASGDEALAGTSRLLPYFQNEINDETRQRDVRALGELIYMLLVGKAPPAPGTEGAAPGESITRRGRPNTPAVLARLVDETLLTGVRGKPRTAGELRDALTAFIWNERAESDPPATLGIPLSAPPTHGPANAPTLPVGENVPPLPEADVPATLRAATLAGEQAASAMEVPNPIAQEWARFMEQLRPWATRNRVPLSSAGALLAAAIFLGVLLANLRHAEAPAPRADVGAGAVAAGSASPAPPGVGGAVSFDIRPWGEVIIDGKPTGVVPPMKSTELPGGHHHIEIRHANAPSWQTDVDIQGPGPVMIEHVFP
jgi:eukaryotic-like serine/threonine-protein kinase